MTVGADSDAPPIFASTWPDPVVPPVSLPEFLLATAAEFVDRPAIVDAASGRTLSYGELADAVCRVAAGLAALGLRPGQAFAVLAPNSPEWLIACYGAMAAGGVVTGINPLYTPGEVATQLADAGARFVLTVPACLPTARAAAEQAGGQARIIVLGSAPGNQIPFTSLLAHTGPPPERIDPGDLAMLPYSRGTTGLAKGVMLSHRACLTNVVQMLTATPVACTDRVLAVAPFFHAVGFVVLAGRTLASGGTLVTLPRFDVTGFLAALQDHRITQTVVVPPIVLALAKHPAVDQYDLSSLQWLGCGAAPLGAELQQACAQRIGCPVGQGYGMTEATAGIALWSPGLPDAPGSSGRLLPGVQARLIDPDTAADCRPGQPGELWVRTPSLMTGYLGHPSATAATIDPGGWLHTGDIARFDTAGNLFIVDRAKELIKVKGFQVAPAELEAILRSHPAVTDAAVLPVPDARAGERPKAYVVPARRVTPQELIEFVAERVAPHKRIHEVAFVDAIPTSPSGKTLRRLLAAPVPTGGSGGQDRPARTAETSAACDRPAESITSSVRSRR
jgi:acyl-CoA synthetase (AMP-forming)/AMP-acid ligase II